VLAEGGDGFGKFQVLGEFGEQQPSRGAVVGHQRVGDIPGGKK